jgi:hypothetical protein
MSLLEPQVSTAPLSITHKDGFRSIQVMAKTEEGVTPTEITATFTPVLDRMQETWPPNYRYSFGGEVEETVETFASASDPGRFRENKNRSDGVAAGRKLNASAGDDWDGIFPRGG